ncbi:hypothetical protein KC19_8G111000 [Ceratodon purpureus]|uniref:Uncharacterized protein n=1 Tax=Ceratodon purpureus TaxID=3225 RepID=A0A8T0H2W9_CERPU|nr:hypothetical protein KC19_8G111000 [Ceratodon purpureus]
MRMQGMGTSSTQRRGLESTAASPSSHGMRVTKRAIVGRRAAPTTPVPSWRVFNNQLYDSMTRAPPASARKLAASLWELQDLPLPACLSACLHSPNWLPRDLPRGSPDSGSPHSQPDHVLSPPGCHPGSHRHVKTGTSRYDYGVSMQSQAHLHKLLSKASNMESGGMVDRQRHIPCALFTTGTRKGEVESQPGHTVSTTMSQELLKVFSQIRLLEEQHNTSLSVTSALHGELVAAQARVRELEAPHRNARKEVETLLKKFSDEKMAWKAKEKEKIKAAVQSVQEQLDDERAARQRLESANRRLTRELMEAQSATATALQELENERKARQLMEEVCQELAQETGDDKAEVEEMKRESQKVREELEEERRMLQLAEVWREERVQMKLGEAKLALEEKSAVLDVMTDELESFLRAQHEGDDDSHLRDAQVLHEVIHAISSFPTGDYIPQDSEPSSFQEERRLKQDAHESESRGEPLYYAEGIPDAD